MHSFMNFIFLELFRAMEEYLMLNNYCKPESAEPTIFDLGVLHCDVFQTYPKIRPLEMRLNAAHYTTIITLTAH